MSGNVESPGRSASYPSATDLWARPPEDMPTDEGGHDDHHLVVTHSEVVAERCKAQARVSGDRDREYERSQELKWVTGYCHDFGKLTSWFQIWVRNGSAGIDPNDERRYHSDLGALLAVYALDYRGFELVDQAIAYATIRAHHRSMPDVPDLISEIRNISESGEGPIANRFDRYAEQLDDIDDEVPDVADAMVQRATSGVGSFAEFRQRVADQSVVDPLTDTSLRFVFGQRDLYGEVLQSYSELKFADVSHSAGTTDRGMLDASPLDAEKLDDKRTDYKETDRPGIQGDLDDLRTRAQETITNRIERMNGGPDAPSVGRIWLPTGFGKTIGGLLAAQKLGAMGGECERLIYTLPFTSIIDQVSEEISDVFDVSAGAEGGHLIVHHYLAGDDSARSIDREGIDEQLATSIERMLGTTWSAGCVVSTFVQLFESLVAPSGSQAPKLPSLHESVVILDEPQELPPELWPLIGRVIAVLVNDYNARVLLMTATQPGLIKYSEADIDVIDLIDDDTPYVEFLHEYPRVTYDVHESARDYVLSSDPTEATEAVIAHSEAAETLVDDLLAGGRDSSTLAVCNTTTSSQTLFTHVSATLQDEGYEPISIPHMIDGLVRDDDALPRPTRVRRAIRDRIQTALADGNDPMLTCNLTARHRPVDRRLILDVLTGGDIDEDDPDEGLLNRSDAPIAIIATRLIEAGVDIEFEAVWRDIAPVPSIVQSGGRCNREFGGDGTGTVTIWRLASIDESGRTPAEHIYDHGSESGMAQTRQAIRAALPTDEPSIDEAAMITTVVNHYYNAVAEYDPGQWDRVTQVDSCDANSLSSVSLIGPSPWLSDVIVTRTSGEQRTVKRLIKELNKSGEERNNKAVKGMLAGLREIRYGVPVPGVDGGADDSIPEEAVNAGFALLSERKDLWHIHGDASGYNADHGVY